MLLATGNYIATSRQHETPFRVEDMLWRLWLEQYWGWMDVLERVESLGTMCGIRELGHSRQLPIHSMRQPKPRGSPSSMSNMEIRATETRNLDHSVNLPTSPLLANVRLNLGYRRAPFPRRFLCLAPTKASHLRSTTQGDNSIDSY